MFAQATLPLMIPALAATAISTLLPLFVVLLVGQPYLNKGFATTGTR